MTNDPLEIEQRDQVAYWTLNRPEAMNALNSGLLDRLAAAADQAKHDPEVRVVVIRGAGGRAFCAGADLDEISGLSAAAARRHLGHGQAVFRSIEMLGKPVIAAVEGWALGGGFELALASSMILATTKAKFGLPEVKLGLIPGYGGTQRLSREIGRQAALRMMLSGAPVPASEAYALGIGAEPPVAAEALTEAVEGLAAELAANGPLAMGLILDAAAGGGESEVGLAYETALAATALSTADAAEGILAFQEKRPARFRAS
jgi:enoyl-CoA hydratase